MTVFLWTETLVKREVDRLDNDGETVVVVCYMVRDVNKLGVCSENFFD